MTRRRRVRAGWTFRDLVEEFRRRGLRRTQRPRTMLWVARELGISRMHLYNLMAGTRRPSPWTVAKVARATGYPEEDVVRAVGETLRRRAAEQKLLD